MKQIFKTKKIFGTIIPIIKIQNKLKTKQILIVFISKMLNKTHVRNFLCKLSIFSKLATLKVNSSGAAQADATNNTQNQIYLCTLIWDV